MFKKIIYSFGLMMVIVPLFAPALAFAAPNIWPTGFWGPILSCTGNTINTAAIDTTAEKSNNSLNSNTNGAANYTIPYSENKNACTSLCDLINTAINLIYFGISVALFIITPILFAWGGIKFMISQGSPNGISEARKILTGALVGLLIVLGSWLIVNTVVSFLNISHVGGFSENGCSLGAKTTNPGNSTNPVNPSVPPFSGFGGGEFGGGGATGSY